MGVSNRLLNVHIVKIQDDEDANPEMYSRRPKSIFSDEIWRTTKNLNSYHDKKSRPKYGRLIKFIIYRSKSI